MRLRCEALALLLLVACRASAERYTVSWGGLDGGVRAACVDVRRELDAGRLEAARRALIALTDAHPDSIDLAAWLQDVESALLIAGHGVDAELAEDSARLGPAGAMRLRYRRRADASDRAGPKVLAARMETDAPAAQLLLESAGVADPEEPWVHYGQAHATLQITGQKNRWQEARDHLQEALRRDPGFLRARRLEAWMLAQEGSGSRALQAWSAWLEASVDDPRVAREDRVEAMIDVAVLQVQSGSAARARNVLLALEGEPIARARRLMVLAAAEQAVGDVDAALDAARRAEWAAEESDVLPLVQQAILLEDWMPRGEAAEATWRRILERALAFPDGRNVMQAMRARVLLERAEAQSARSEG